MAFNPFIGWSESELTTLLRTLQEEWAAGGVITSAGSGDVSSQHQVQASIRVRMNDVLRALHRLNPDAYPLTDLPRNRTVAVMGEVI